MSSRTRGSPTAPGTPQSQPRSVSTEVYRCHLCKRSYERADHLNRHLKSHENARPHKCTRCTKGFNRADLLNRHQASHDRYANGDNKGLRVQRLNRVAAACKACITSKSKCQDQKPCVRCQTRGVPCETTLQSSRVHSVPTTEVHTGHSGFAEFDSHNVPDHSSILNAQDTQASPDTEADATQHRLPVEDIATEPDRLMLDGIEASNTILDYYNESHATTNVDTNAFDDMYGNRFSFLDHGSLFNPNLGVLPWSSHFSQEVDFGMGDIDIESVELLYDNLNNSQTTDETLSQGNTNDPGSNAHISKRYAAFKRSPWLWTPTNKDQTFNDQSDISLDEDIIPPVLTPVTQGSSSSEVTPGSIDSRMRDKMLALLFSIPQLTPQTSSFPSLALLNTIIEVYFIQQSFRFDQFIHSGALSPTKSLPQLFMAIISGGSTFISTPAIWKMGLALQEISRHTVANSWEQNNANTRNLQALQAFMICLDVGLWSGFKRKMEIAESFAQPLIIMLRRSGAFNNRPDAPVLMPANDDSEATLESKWRMWVERESFKRLILHLFFHDVHASAGLQKPPLISMTELKFGLPASRELWMAKTATEWKDVYLARAPYGYDKYTFIDALEDPESLLAVSDYLDIHLCAMTLLHGYWYQIWALAESKKFYPTSRTTHHLSLITTHRELYSDLLDLAKKLPSTTGNSPVATLLSEFFMMILHVSPEDLHLFAGKSGEDEARDACLVFKAWTQTPASRTAIWHAGQVLRAAESVMPTQLNGFNAIVLYYSSLTLWVYGMVTLDPQISIAASGQQSAFATSTLTTTGPLIEVALNKPEAAEMIKFKANGRGIPGITGLNSEMANIFVPLKATDKILGIARQIYRSNFPDVDEPLPPLVANLANLLNDLCCLPSSKMSRAASERPQ